MVFEKIDRKNWPRNEYFERHFSNVPCTYSMTVRLDITPVIVKRRKIYPVMLYCLTTIVNRHPEFRTAINRASELGVYSDMTPYYTVFHKDTETFSNLWMNYSDRIEEFCAEYEKDVRLYGSRHGITGKPDAPDNIFTVSMIPWTTFEGFHLNLQKDYDYLLPVFTMGKYVQEKERFFLPLAVQVHHAVCDGFHVCRFINELQELINNEPDLSGTGPEP